jgi:ParB family chromosome partitioning protein
LLDQGEERLIEGVQRGAIPLTTALEIARAKDGDENLGDMLQEAYENGQLKGRQIIEAKRLIEKRQEHGPASPNADQIKPPTSSYSLVRTYQKEVDRQRKMVLKAEHAHQRLLLVVQGLKKLFADESFVNLLRAEGLDTLPKYLSDRISAPDTSTPAITTPTQPELEGESA